MRSMKSNLLRSTRGQSLIETALLLPFLLVLTFNAVNLGYFFYVYLNLTTAPRQGAEYSIQGQSSYLQSTLPSADDVNTLVTNGIGGSLPSASNTPTRVCTLALGLDSNGLGTSSQVPLCNNYGSGTGTFTTLQPDPEAPLLVLNRVDIQYQVAPLIPGGAFNLIFPSTGLTFHRWVYMRAEN